MAEERRPPGDARAGVQSQRKGRPLERGGRHLSWEEAPAGADTGRFGCGGRYVSSGRGSLFSPRSRGQGHERARVEGRCGWLEQKKA